MKLDMQKLSLDQRKGEEAYDWLQKTEYPPVKWAWPGRSIESLLTQYTPQEIFAVCHRCGHQIINGVIVHI